MEILKAINWLDVVVLFLLIRCVFLGIRSGLTIELYRFIGTVLSLAIAIHWYSQVGDILIANLGLPAWLSDFLSFITITLLIRSIFKYGLALLIKLLNMQFVSPLERPGGGAAGLARGIFATGVLVLALSFFPSDFIKESLYDKSFSGAFLVEAMQRTYKSLTFWLPGEKTAPSIFTKVPVQETKPKKPPQPE